MKTKQYAKTTVTKTIYIHHLQPVTKIKHPKRLTIANNSGATKRATMMQQSVATLSRQTIEHYHIHQLSVPAHFNQT